MSDYVVVADALCVAFAAQKVLDNVSFQVSQGEVFALLGGNGAGKSTALKTFLGTVKPSAGSATVMGMSINDDINKIRRKVAYLPESVMLYGHLSGVENIQYLLSLAAVKRSAQEIEAALTRVGLQASAWPQRMSHYSKGMRQKTAIALALLREAPVLFLDEPTSGLDPSAIDEFNQLITSLSESGTSIFMVTHDVYGACQVAHRIGLLDRGRIVGMFDRQHQQQIDTEQVHAAFATRKAQ